MIKKTFLFFLGILTALIFAELFLQSIDIILTAGRSITGNSKEKTGIIKISCLGDSWTSGYGAPTGKSYPAQLENLMNSHGQKSIVYNWGKPGLTTSTALKKIPSLLDKQQPDIVILLSGLNDRWNMIDSNVYLTDDKINLYKIRLKNLIMDSFIYNIYTYNSSQEKGAGTIIKHPEDQMLKKIIIETLEKIESDQNFSIDIDHIKKEAGIDTDNPDLYYRNGFILTQLYEYSEALRYFDKCLELDFNNYNGRVFESTGLIYRNAENNLIKKQLRELYDKHGFKQSNLSYIKDIKILKKLIKYNLNRIKKLTEKKDVILVIQSYFTLSQQNDDFYLILKESAKEAKIPFIDNYEPLKNINDVENYFHTKEKIAVYPNQNGYRLMAENTYRNIAKLYSKQ